MEHTPTPWERSSGAIFSEGKDGANICFISSPRKSHLVEYVRLEINDPDFSEAMANAAFIVQAVNSHDELLDMLEKAVDFIKHEPFQRQGSDREIVLARLTMKIQAAIHNATKESNE